ncbi:MAG: hypothetical protein ITG00_07040 [Flavobacterium sp.]|nr:hypothetical protein [Flavobacterium sp.]
MKIYLLPLFLFVVSIASAQQLHLNISGSSINETATIDSIGYQKTFPNARAITTEVNRVSLVLEKIGYFEREISDSRKSNDSTFAYIFSLKNQTRAIHIYSTDENPLSEIALAANDTILLHPTQVEDFLNTTMARLEAKGYSLATLQLKNFAHSRGRMYAQLTVTPGAQRQLNDIVVNGYDKFPAGHKRNIERLYRNRTFNQQTLKSIHTDFQKYRFINQTKYPEILFSQDTTKLYVYVEKSKPNRFDGFIGFANDDQTNKLIFTGYLDLLLVNFMNTGEEFTLYWKSDGNEQKTFNVGIELPYIFKSPFGLKASLNIFKQDSTFQNTRSSADLGYFFNYNTRLYIGYQSTESSDIQNQNSFSINDYKNTFFTSNLEYTAFTPDDFLFPQRTRFNLKAGVGNRKSNLNNDGQYFVELNAYHNFYLNDKNVFHVRSQNYYLQSDGYIINELYRFGGINSIRGFNENSLQANTFTSLLTEYRFVPSPNLYVHSIIDYGYFRDQTSDLSGSLLGLGIGFGLLTNNGLLNLVYANGSTNDQSIKLSNSIVHISFKTTF